jgi:hypothetical protein
MSCVHITLCETILRKIIRIARAQFVAASKSDISRFRYPIALGMHLQQINVNFTLLMYGKAKV